MVYDELILTLALDYIHENWPPLQVVNFCMECRDSENPVGRCKGCKVTLCTKCGSGRMHVERQKGHFDRWVCTSCAMQEAHIQMDPDCGELEQ
jgi:hypothetical protein